MSRVKERENVLCAVGVEGQFTQRRATLWRSCIGPEFYSLYLHRNEPRKKDQNSFYDAGCNISPRAVLETANIQQTQVSREICQGRAAAALLEFPMIPVIKTTEEI
jgi:hypothetical protein